MSDSDFNLYMSDPQAASVDGFIAALGIFRKYMESEKHFCSAEHDILYIHVDSNRLPEDSEDGIALQKLGFHLASEIDTWACFT